MAAWPRIAALAMLLAAMVALMAFQWLPALLFLPAAGALLVWDGSARGRSSGPGKGHG
ncbi:hypothetical protein M2368_001540 [Arthrobacter sp. JUb119]|uniref:hypothetical protein n=1 Tax=Micrococcaceae TaxID=1268 RepID=UPI0010D51753|nr:MULTISPECIES: hypothetical protein [unclassified Arthrobacter]MCS3492537.1 hypothetical protein [Arthrobacter sp. JUb119]TDU30318.1 hypothetical protein EDF61_101277 [Arthrobacter sp. JUb115]